MVYLRQSSLQQVKQNKESQRLQYALADKAKALGFHHVEIIDCDLGVSAGPGAQAREGFNQVRNRAKHEELIGYLEKHRQEIIDYSARQAVGKPIGSGRMEKGVDQVIGHRQKKKGMAWSAKGSKALAILKVVELNGQWQQLWFPEEQKLKTAA